MATDLRKRRSQALEPMQSLVASYNLIKNELLSNQLPTVWLDLGNKPGRYGYFEANNWKDANGNLLDVVSLLADCLLSGDEALADAVRSEGI